MDCFCGRNVSQFIGRLLFIETTAGPLVPVTPIKVLCFDKKFSVLTVQSTGGTVFYVCCKKNRIYYFSRLIDDKAACHNGSFLSDLVRINL
ncbi:hypothetical protein BACCIP111883_03607 [Sutcliffiella rhizosphaerae]|uniref:Uncharacterized protein n=1 Tax=Sutcliffiella rhizosphaerae TaxID=2880967 RepID=A0ABM8YS85_9BACI|nr:hypothetical protein BACCIP111883_03607 [Sutcliffiella rhizosphaerae]